MCRHALRYVATSSSGLCVACIVLGLLPVRTPAYAATNDRATQQSIPCDQIYGTEEGIIVGLEAAGMTFFLCLNEDGVLNLKVDQATLYIESREVNSRNMPALLQFDGGNRPDAKQFYYPFDWRNIIRDSVNREGRFVCFPEFDTFGSDLPTRARALASCLRTEP